MKNLTRLALLTFLLPVLSFGADSSSHEQHEENVDATGVETLSHGLRDLLSKEMQALQLGMMSIIPAYNSGNWDEIESTAKNMKNSYILKQNLTADQLKELHAALPEAFIKKDQHFHYLAGMLGHAAENEKPELVNFYFSEMNEACIDCHTAFATHKFPALSPTSDSVHSH